MTNWLCDNNATHRLHLRAVVVAWKASMNIITMRTNRETQGT
jgi:hypothetical protein